MRIGIYNRWLATLGGGEQYSLAIADYLSLRYSVDVISHQSVDARQAGERLGLDLSRVRFVKIPFAANSRAAVTASYDFFINASNWDFFPSAAQKSALIIYFPFDPGNKLAARLRYAAGQLLHKKPFQLLTHSLLSRNSAIQTRLDNLIAPDFLRDVDSYCQLWSISKFSKDWTTRYWQRPSELLYPAVDVETFHPQPKQPIILNVGRFFAGNHNKKHLLMIEAFKQMVDDGLHGWELHLAGGLNRGIIHEEYLRQVKAAIADYPIAIHVDQPRTDLIDLYERSSIYWHASGFGEDELRQPQKFEHFGITTVEAMAAGATPVVIGKGGQPELMEDGVTGLLWQSQSELMMQTRRLLDNPQMMQQLASAAVKHSRQFNHQHFHQRLDQLLVAMDIQPIGDIGRGVIDKGVSRKGNAAR